MLLVPATARRRPGLLLDAQRRPAQDPLTGLVTLAALCELVTPLFAPARAGAPLAAAVVDIDGFRRHVTERGYERTDLILVELARTARGLTRSHDLVARSGADELTVIFPSQPLAAANRFAARLGELLRRTAPELTLSAGLAARADCDSFEVLLAQARIGLDIARERGGARIEPAPPRGSEEHDPRRTLAVESLAIATARRDHYEEPELRSTALLARQVCAELGLDGVDADRVAAAVVVRHVGKVAVPDEVLAKRGQLTDAEWALVRQHPLVAERILRSVPGMDAVAHIVRHQHEHWDGDGYPDRLQGALIPLTSRIVHAVDAWSALRSERPYRAARSHTAAVREITASAGRQLDPRVSERLLSRLYWGPRGA